MNKKFLIVVLFVLIFIPDVYASNDVDYQLTITKDYKFEEVIKYKISNYKNVDNGEDYFKTIVDDDVYTDIMYKTKYKKTKTKSNDIYYITLSHTYSEYTFANSLFLHNCFQKNNYDYDKDILSFTGDNGFNCLRGDSLNITIKTDFEVTDTNAIKSGNTYFWNPTGYDFDMNFKINKVYEETPIKNKATGIVEGNNSSDDKDISQDDDYEKEKKNDTKKISLSTILIVLSCIMLFGIIVFVILKKKKNNLNEI